MKFCNFFILKLFSNSLHFKINFKNIEIRIKPKKTDSILTIFFYPFVKIMQMIWRWKAMD